VNASQDPGGRDRPDGLRLLTAFGSPIALASVLMLYYGWARSEAQAKAFGADASVFEMSTQDMIFRSVNVVFPAIVALLFVSLALIRYEPWLRERTVWLAPVLRHAWVLVVIGLVIAVIPRTEKIGRVLIPSLVMLAVSGTAYSAVLRRRASGDESALPFGTVVLVVLLLVAMLFLQTERFAAYIGEGLAEAIMVCLDEPDDDECTDQDRLSPAIVLTTGRLHIEAPDVIETPVEGQEDTTFRYRYEGLYFLQRSGTKYFLLTKGWEAGSGRLVLLHDSQDVRLEFGARPPMSEEDGQVDPVGQ
jgi:hypothetical protein